MSEPRHPHLNRVTPDPTQLKALAHPVRMRMLEMLRLDGPATSTSLAARLGLNTGTVSYHLRQLALHGFIEDDAERGTRRDRWWRTAHEFTHVRHEDPSDIEDQNVRQAFLHAAVLGGMAQLQDSLLERSELPREWASVTENSDWTIWLTPQEARGLMERVNAVIREAVDAAPRHRDQAPEGSEQYSIQLHGFPRPGRLVSGGAS